MTELTSLGRLCEKPVPAGEATTPVTPLLLAIVGLVTVLETVDMVKARRCWWRDWSTTAAVEGFAAGAAGAVEIAKGSSSFDTSRRRLEFVEVEAVTVVSPAETPPVVERGK